MPQRIEGTITLIKSEKHDTIKDNRWMLATVIDPSGQNILVKGPINRPAEKGDYIVGNFSAEDGRTGVEYKSTALIEIHLPRTPRAILDRCVRIAQKECIQVTPTIRTVIEMCATSTTDFWKSIPLQPHSLTGISLSRFGTLLTAIGKYTTDCSPISSSLEVEEYLTGLGLRWSSATIRKLLGYDKDCEEPDREPILLDALQNDPLCIVDIPGIKESQITEYLTALARLGAVDKTTIAVGELMKKCLPRHGDCSIPMNEDSVEPLRENPLYNKYLMEYNGDLYRSSIRKSEEVVADFIVDCVVAEPHFDDEDILERLAVLPPDGDIRPNEEQQAAVSAILLNRISTVQGSAGSGKTTSLRLLTRYIKEFMPDIRSNILFLAPTGRAANRIKESIADIELSASDNILTIHRYYGLVKAWRARCEKYGSCKDVADCIANPMIIVADESSMICIQTMAMLVNTLRTYDVLPHIVFMGDPYQLTPVGRGAPFIDMLSSGVIHTTLLKTVHRQGPGSNLLMAVNELRETRDISVSDPTSFQIIRVFKRDLLQRIKRWLDANPGDLNTIIVPTNSLVDDLTPFVRDHVNPVSPATSLYAGETLVSDYRKGDKVMQIKNNYARTVFNGDVGVVVDLVAVKDEREKGGKGVTVYNLMVHYAARDNVIAYRLSEAAEELRLAYVITTHKAQGSEYDNVLIINEFCQGFVNRNLIYTAASRGKKSVKIFITELDIIKLWKDIPAKPKTNLVENIRELIE